jgi:hypothetical protein
MALLRAKWFVMGLPVGFWWGWKKSSVWEMEKVVESALPPAVAKHVVGLLPKGTADTRQKLRLQESIRENGRRQEETIRKLQETVRMQELNAARVEKKHEQTIRSLKENAARQEAGQEQTNRLLQAVLARLPEDGDQRVAPTQGSSPPTTATPPAPPKQ